jgi:hypothetical protein
MAFPAVGLILRKIDRRIKVESDILGKREYSEQRKPEDET